MNFALRVAKRKKQCGVLALVQGVDRKQGKKKKVVFVLEYVHDSYFERKRRGCRSRGGKELFLWIPKKWVGVGQVRARVRAEGWSEGCTKSTVVRAWMQSASHGQSREK